MSVGLLPKCCGFITLSASVISLSLAPQHPTVEDLLSPDQAGFRKGRSTCNLYSNDLPVTRGRKFIYADGICLDIQGQYLSELECSLSSDMARMSHFCRQWRLKPSVSKTISSVFHLHNTRATRELSVYLDGQRLRHECHPVTQPILG